ncbi:PREDICTED: piggyBac transposable element-derived protein 4-like [Dufourea novaeangliae]|uniref:piggyBac transposable element-derived protein 4-like n=1 Tax=Dufourea novaeangliae TaxID=178035 RepID=UPI0007679DFC|nr:PREDICTED: piggyBac transposable element-derived protein 4-like [Dufourea novaeangliae]
MLYTGKDTNYGSNYPQEKQSTRIVLELTHDLLNKGYRIYLDNFYTSIHLAKLLCQNNTDIVGTMRINRVGIPSEIKTKKLQKNEHKVRFKDKLMVLKWKDKKDVLMLSSIHNDEKTMIEKRGRRQEKPNVVLDYNKNMGGVDLGDGVMVAYTAARNRLKKYYETIFLRLIDMCCFNAYIIYKKDKGHLDRLHCLIECVEKLVDNNIVKTHPKTSTSSSTPKPSRLVKRHFPEQMKSDIGKTKSRKCRVCYKKGVRKESTYWCPDCKVALCINNCFKISHKEVEF